MTDERWATLWLIIVIFAFALIWTAIAHAQEHNGHPLEDQEIHERFYNTWMMPDNRSISCCHKMDCSPAESRYDPVQKRWLARKVGETGEFTPIPPSKVEMDRDTPDGRSHLCGRNGWPTFTVFCFIPGAGG